MYNQNLGVHMKTQYDVCEYDSLFRYRKGQTVNDNLILEYIKIKDSKGKNKRGYLCKCTHDGYIRPLEQYKLDKGLRCCSVCAGKVIIEGVNDVATTKPELVQYIHDKSLIHCLTLASDRTIELECPICHTVKKGTLHQINADGFSCLKCGDGRTIPNKLMYLILEKNNVEFECAVAFKWCSFPSYKNDKVTHGVYDFVVESKKLIIEMDGGLGHGKKLHYHSKKTLEETVYIDKMKDKLAIENGYKLIRIDCDYTEDNKFEYLHKSLSNSSFTNYFDISNIDMAELFNEANNTSLVKEASILWNQGLALGEIREKLKYGKVTIRKYLKIGTKVGLCNYDETTAYERGKRHFSNGVWEYSLHFPSALEFSEFLETYGIPLNFHTIKNRFVSGNVDETIIDGIRIVRTKHKE